MKTVKFEWWYYDWIDARSLDNVGELVETGTYEFEFDSPDTYSLLEDKFYQYIEAKESLQPFNHEFLIHSMSIPTPKN